MTDIASLAHVQQALSPLHVRAYFDEELFAREQETIFKQSAIYVGHEKGVPEPGDWRRLPHEEGGRVLVRNPGGVELISNVCRHRQALILGGQTGAVTGPGNPAGNLTATGGNIVCPLHRWTYDNRGQILGAPQFPSTPCLNLPRFPLKSCHGSAVRGAARSAGRPGPAVQPAGVRLQRLRAGPCGSPSMQLQLEDLHRGLPGGLPRRPFHPGLGRFVTCEDLSWEFAEQYSLQRVGVHDSLEKPGSDVYRDWHDTLMRYRGGSAPDYGAIWVTYFPTHMIELYPHVLVLSTLYPKSPQETINIAEFYYPEEIALFEREFVEAQRAAYMETAVEDDEIGERMDAGRLALLRRGVSESGPYQSPMEDGMLHFHEWYRRVMGERIGNCAA